MSSRCEDAIGVVVTSTGDKYIILREHMTAMKDDAIQGNIGHFDNEIEMAVLERSGATLLSIKPRVERWTFGVPASRSSCSSKYCGKACPG